MKLHIADVLCVHVACEAWVCEPGYQTPVVHQSSKADVTLLYQTKGLKLYSPQLIQQWFDQSPHVRNKKAVSMRKNNQASN